MAENKKVDFSNDIDIVSTELTRLLGFVESAKGVRTAYGNFTVKEIASGILKEVTETGKTIDEVMAQVKEGIEYIENLKASLPEDFSVVLKEIATKADAESTQEALDKLEEEVKESTVSYICFGGDGYLYVHTED